MDGSNSRGDSPEVVQMKNTIIAILIAREQASKARIYEVGNALAKLERFLRQTESNVLNMGQCVSLWSDIRKMEELGYGQLLAAFNHYKGLA